MVEDSLPNYQNTFGKVRSVTTKSSTKMVICTMYYIYVKFNVSPVNHLTYVIGEAYDEVNTILQYM